MAILEVKKRVKNAILYTNGCIKVENVRFSYPHLDKPFAGKAKNDEGKAATPKYGIVGMLPKKTHAEAKELIVEAMNALMQANECPKLAPEKKFMRNGDDQDEAVYSGHWTVSAREERAPSVRDKRGQLITDPKKIADLIEGGYWGHILIRPWFQDNDYGKRINAGLVGVQHIKDDETFGEGRIDDSDAWTDESGAGGSDGGGDDDDGL